MSSPEVDWVLSQVGSVVGSITAPLQRVDRDESRILEGDIRTREGELQESNFVGAALANRPSEPVGFEYDRRAEAIVSVRIEGLHVDQWGHVDPSGSNGIAFHELVRRCRDAIYAGREFPAANPQDVTYHTLFVENESSQSSQHRDYYRTDFDVRFRGYESLP